MSLALNDHCKSVCSPTNVGTDQGILHDGDDDC